jgi:ACS family glucarate transporter-like MFS transporter
VLVNQLGSFDSALLYVGAMGLLGAFAYLFIVGPLKRLEIDDGEDEPQPIAALQSAQNSPN